MLSQAIEDYLKTIYKLHDGRDVSTKEIAEALNVSSASVTKMVKRLDGLGLVTYRAYHGVTLTEAGNKIALEIIRHHRLLETYLREIMGYDWQKMHDEAERLEHHISEEFEDRLDEMLGYPTHDPHGDPIPSRDGEIPSLSSDPLTVFEEGDRIAIHRLKDSDPVVLSRLESFGVLPGEIVTVVSRPTGDGPITVRAGSTEYRIDFVDANSVYGSLTRKTSKPIPEGSSKETKPE